MKNKIIPLLAGMFYVMSAANLFSQPGPFQPKIIENDSWNHKFEHFCYPGIIVSPNNPLYPLSMQSISEVTYEAGEYIQLKDGFSAHNFTSGYFHAYTSPNDLQVLMEPANGQAPKHKKLELFIKLPTGIQNEIDNFITQYKALYQNNPTGYVWDYKNYAGMNPFNPDDISVEATFTSPSNTIKRGWGFFYEEQEYDASLPLTPTTRWNAVATPYPFRVRFCPDELGTWKCVVRVNIDNTKFNLPDVNMLCEMEFECIPSTEKGPVEVGANNYLRYRDDRSTFFPIGSYVGMANFRYDGTFPAAGEIKACRPYEYDDFNQILAGIKDAGANYVRIIPSPSSWGVEMEDVNNYYRRMPHAWEFDKVIEYCEDNQLYFNMLLCRGGGVDSDPLNPNENGEFAWDTYGYKKQMFMNNPLYNQGYGAYTPLDPSLFVTEPQAREEYKKCIRYMMARWGYSSYMAQTEISSESDHTAQIYYEPPGQGAVKYEYSPYRKKILINDNPSTFEYSFLNNYRFKPSTTWMHNGHTLAQYIYDWHHELADYITHTLHVERMVNTCYGAGDAAPDDPTLSDPLFSLTSTHNYNYSRSKEIHKKRFYEAQAMISKYEKPFLFGEMGEDPYRSNTFPLVKSGPSFQNGVQLHSSSWSNCFSGPYGTTPAVVPGPLNSSDPQWPERADSTLKFFQRTIPAIVSFFDGVDMESDRYLAAYNDINDMEAFQLHKNTQAMGYVRMKQWYWATADNPPTSECVFEVIDSNGIATYHSYPTDDGYLGSQYPANPINYQTLPISVNYGSYTIEWYDTWQPSLIISTQTGLISSFGSILAVVPELGFRNANCPDCRQDLAFKVYPDGYHFRSMETPPPSDQEFIVMPNPNNGNYQLSVMVDEATQTQLHILDIHGREIWNEVLVLAEGENRLEMSHTLLSDGVYFIRVDGYKTVQKLVIAK